MTGQCFCSFWVISCLVWKTSWLAHSFWTGTMLNPLQLRWKTIKWIQKCSATAELNIKAEQSKKRRRVYPRLDLKEFLHFWGSLCSSISANTQHKVWQRDQLHLYTLMVLKIKVSTDRQALQPFLRLMNEEFWLASQPDNGAEPVRTVGGDIGVVHTASGSTTSLSGGLAHTQL